MEYSSDVPGFAYCVDAGETNDTARALACEVCKTSMYLIDKDISVTPADCA